MSHYHEKCSKCENMYSWKYVMPGANINDRFICLQCLKAIVQMIESEMDYENG